MVETKKKPRQKQKQRQKQSQTQIVNVTVGEQKSTRKRAPRKPKGPGGGGGGAPPYQRPPVVFFEPQSFPRGTTTVQQPQNPPPAPPGAGAIARNPVVGSALIPETRQQLDAEVRAVATPQAGITPIELPLPRRGVGGRGPSFFGPGGLFAGRARETEPEPTALSAVSMTSASSSAMTRNRPYSSGRIVPSAAVEEVEEPEPTMYAPPQNYEEQPVSAGSVMQSFQFVKPTKMRMDTFGSMDSNVMRALASAASAEVLPDAEQGTPLQQVAEEPEPEPEAAAGAAGWTPPELPALTGQALKSLVFTQAQSIWANQYDRLRESEKKTIRRAFAESSTSGKEYDALRAVIRRFNERQP